MEAIILIGLQASGKSTFCRQVLFDTHLRINLDMLTTRHREDCILRACLQALQPFVIDNTNLSRAERQRYIPLIKSAGFALTGYYFRSAMEECKSRNEQRLEAQRIPLKGLLGAATRLELPSCAEGFDQLRYVRMDGNGGFIVEEWKDEV